MGQLLKKEDVKVADLVPYERNAKQHSEEQVEKIAKSIEEFGFLNPCLIDKDKNIIAGHGRAMAAKKLGLDVVPCVYVEGLTEDQRRAYILADNKLTELGDWDTELVFEELGELEEMGFDTELTGFDITRSSDEQEVEEDDFDEEPPEEPKAKLGDVYQLGNHRLICGDCTDVNVIDKLMGGEKADIAITSPPYGESKSAKIREHYVPGAKNLTTLYNIHEDNPEEWKNLIEGAMASMKMSSMAQFINIQMLADNKRDLIGLLSENSDYLCDIIVWDKGKAPPQMQSNILNNEFEFVFIFAEEKTTRSIPFGDFHGNINNIIRLTVGQNEYADIHKAVYPVELPATIMKIAGKAKSVLDVFGGTGTTLIAAEQLNRKCYMCELDPRYVDVIIARWEKLTGEKAVLLFGGDSE